MLFLKVLHGKYIKSIVNIYFSVDSLVKPLYVFVFPKFHDFLLVCLVNGNSERGMLIIGALTPDP